MDILLILLTSLGTAYLAARLSARGACSAADLTIGLFVGVACIGLSWVLAHDGAGSIGLPVFVACALTLGLESLQQRSSWR